MNKYIYDESNGLWYELQGKYYLPCLTLPPEEEKPIGIWRSPLIEGRNRITTKKLLKSTQNEIRVVQF